MILTRCPNCSTVFRVTPEQLRVRHGQVRCGSCYATFNALSELSEDLPQPRTTPDARDMGAAVPFGDGQAEAPTVSEILPAVAAPPEPEGAWPGEEIEYIDIGSAAPAEPDLSLAEAAPEAAMEAIAPAEAPSGDSAAGSGAEPGETEHPAKPDGAAPVIETGPPAETTPAADEVAEAAPEAAVEEAMMPEPPEPPAKPPQAAEPPGHTDAEISALAEARTAAARDVEQPTETPALTDARAEPPASPEPPAFEPPIAPGPPPPGFGTDERRPSQWPWWAGAALALVALALQAVIHFRTELAVRHPDARPALEALCAPLGCDIPLPAKIGLIEIEHSDLVPHDKNANRLLLTATLRNLAGHPQAWPHLELTLTDAHDRPLTRRALAPQDYLASAELVAAGFPAHSEQVVSLEVRAAQVPAVGYRLYLFYP